MANTISKKNSFHDYLFILAGMAIFAVGFTIFILPHQIITGGMAGFSSLVYFATGEVIPISAIMFICNGLMLAAGFKTLGKNYVINTIIGVAMLSVLVGMLEGFFNSRPPLVEDITMSVLMGSIVCGIGIGMYYAHNGSGGGTDIIVAWLDRKGKSTVGRTMMIVDITIVTLSFFLPFDGDMDARIQTRVQTILYGWTSIFIYSYITDKFVNANRKTKQLIIISANWEKIADRVAREANRGVTILNGSGYWSKEERTILIVWCRQYDAEGIYRIVHSVDEEAFIICSDAANVYGKGFDKLKLKMHKVKN